MTKLIKIFICITLLYGLIGCSASSHIIVGNSRPAISPQLVKLYTKPPPTYEEIAIIDASSKSSWAFTDQGKMDKAVERLKEEAAKLGANGILIGGTGDISTGAVTVGTANAYGNSATGYGISGSALHKSAKGMAIYVPNEK